MTKVLIKRRPAVGIQLAVAAEAIRFRLGDTVMLVGLRPWWVRAVRWIAVKVFGRKPAPVPHLRISAIDHGTGTVTAELVQ